MTVGAALCVIGHTPEALSFGALIPELENASPGLQAARVLVVRDGGTIEQTYQVSVDWQQTNKMAWVVPVEADAEVFIGQGCDEVFGALEMLTEPRIVAYHRQRTGCDCDDWAPESPLPAPLGTYGWVPNSQPFLEASEQPLLSVAEVAETLEGDNISLSTEQEDDLQRYVNHSYRLYVLISRDDLQSATICVQTRRPSTGVPQYILPLRGARGAAAGEVEFLVYGADTERLEPPYGANPGSDYPAVELEPNSLSLGDGGTPDYNALFEQGIASGPHRALVVEYSAVPPSSSSAIPSGLWLTRLRTRMNPNDMVSDLPLVRVGQGEVSRDFSVLIASSRAARPLEGLLAALAVGLGLVVFRRRRRGTNA